jgi:hypothetical protein
MLELRVTSARWVFNGLFKKWAAFLVPTKEYIFSVAKQNHVTELLVIGVSYIPDRLSHSRSLSFRIRIRRPRCDSRFTLLPLFCTFKFRSVQRPGELVVITHCLNFWFFFGGCSERRSGDASPLADYEALTSAENLPWRIMKRWQSAENLPWRIIKISRSAENTPW